MFFCCFFCSCSNTLLLKRKFLTKKQCTYASQSRKEKFRHNRLQDSVAVGLVWKPGQRESHRKAYSQPPANTNSHTELVLVLISWISGVTAFRLSSARVYHSTIPVFQYSRVWILLDSRDWYPV